MFSKKRTGKSNVIKKILLILSVCMIITGCSDPLSDTETPGTGANNGNNNTPGGRYARELWGEWIRMDTGDAWYISNNSVTVNGAGQNITNTITKESDRVIKVTGGTHDYFLYASRTATSNFTGIISDIRQAAGRAAINTSRQVLVENINNAGDSRIVQPALTDGNFEVGESIAGDEYRISFPGDPGIPPVTVKPGYSGDDIGTITLAEGVSFKVSVKPQNPQTTDMTLLYADNTVYPLYIEIVNTGTVSSAGAFISAMDFGGLEYSPRDYDNIVGTILPGAAKRLYFSVSCAPYEENIPSIDRKIGITIRDVNGTAWADSVQLQFHKASVEFNVKSNKQVQGVVITPNQKSYHFLCNTANSFSSSVTLPWAAEPYLVVFSGAVLENETRYSFGVNVVPGTDFLSLREPTVHEPNNTEAQAYEMDVQEERQVMSYLHLNDIDYYRVDLGPVPPEGGGVGGGNLTVTFNANGAAGGAAPAAMNANLNANIILPGIGSLTRTGYSFGGWSVNGNGTAYAAGSLYRVTGNVTLYAVWNVVNTVAFSANGASGTAPAAVIVSQNTDITLPNEGNLSRTGYSFGGWNTAANGSGTTYAAGSFYTITGNITLYAKWECIITFDSNGAAGGTAPSAMSANQNATITLPGQGNLTRTGYSFGGWNTSANGSGTTYAAGSSYTVTGNVTLYAKWECIITFDSNGAENGTTPAAVTVNQNTDITLPSQENLARTGYSFGGWNTAANGGGTTYAAGSSYTVTGNVTLYAKWDVISIEMVQINPGTFTRNGYTITLTNGFYMGKYTVSQEQYQAVMGNNPSSFSSNPASGEVQGRRPVESVSWYDAIVFCNKLSIAEGLIAAYRINNSTDPSDWGAVPTSSNATWDAVQVVAGSTGYRLPTEAQWEYACRADTTTTWSFGSNESDLTNYAWYDENSNYITHEVGKKLPNAWGLHDMHGNVYEWCWDWFGSYPNTAQADPTGSASGSSRLLRGGNWGNWAEGTASANRNYNNPSNRDGNYGFRLLRP